MERWRQQFSTGKPFFTGARQQPSAQQSMQKFIGKTLFHVLWVCSDFLFRQNKLNLMQTDWEFLLEIPQMNRPNKYDTQKGRMSNKKIHLDRFGRV